MASSLSAFITGLKNDIKADVESAMNTAESRSRSDVKREFEEFYDGGKPTLYQRTNTLKKSWRSSNGSAANGSGWNGKKYMYSFWIETPYYGKDNINRQNFKARGFKSYFEGMMVISAANKGVAHIVGSAGFWDRSLAHIEKQFYNALGERFD